MHHALHLTTPSRAVLKAITPARHTRLLLAYQLIVLGHFSEHLVQVTQAFVLGWARPESGGVLGLWFPALMRNETLHFGYNLLQLVGLLLLAEGFRGAARKSWNVAILTQGWHFFEHFLLQAQWLVGIYLFGGARQTSIGELLLPRIELHFAYNMFAFVPTMLAVYLHYRAHRRRQTAS